MDSQLSRLKDLFLDLIFPPRCIGCGKYGRFFCDSCLASLPYLAPPFCKKCGRPVPEAGLCHYCLAERMSIDVIRSPFRFSSPIREAVHALKYRGLTAVSPVLASLIGEWLRENPLSGDVIVPVPLHPKRLRERGFNQSRLLAQKLSELIQIPLSEGSLIRVKNTMAQARTPNAEKRRENVYGAFKCLDSALTGAKVILFDDVCTTGSTLDSCARALKEAGVKEVLGLTLARET